jgi:hypothetical protein
MRNFERACWAAGQIGKLALITALVVLGVTMLSFGQTVTPQETEKLISLRRRGEAGDVKAQFELGFMYEYGTGGAHPDVTESLRWYHKAAERGDIAARHSIAGMYFEGIGVTKDYPEAARWYGCPKPSTQALANCRAISYKALPQGALDLLTKMKCDVSSNYDYGSAFDLNGDGEPEYQVCCHDSPHGPCGARVIGKIGSVWKDLTAKDGVDGYADACGRFNDVCLPNQCSMVSSPPAKPCVPTIWHFINGRYRSVEYTPAALR